MEIAGADTRAIVMALTMGGLSAIIISAAPTMLVSLESGVLQELSLTSSPTKGKTDGSGAQTDDLNSEEELVTEILKEVTKLGAHPQDPQKPAGIPGVSDENVKQLPVNTVQDLVSLSYDTVQQHGSAQHLFALGRILLLQGDVQGGQDLLEKASDAGSAAASFYLALSLENDEERSYMLIQDSASKGFPPGQELAAELQEAQRQAEIDSLTQFADYEWPDFLQAAYKGDTQEFAKHPLTALRYISDLNKTLGELHYWAKDGERFLAIYDAGLDVALRRKLFQNPGMVNEATEAATSVLQRFLGGYKSAMKSVERGENPTAAVVGAVGSIFPKNGVTYHELGKLAQYDAKQLIHLFNEHPEIFEQLYKGIQHFVKHEL